MGSNRVPKRRVLPIVLGCAAATAAVLALARFAVVAWVPRGWPRGCLDLGVVTNDASFGQALGVHLPFGVSIAFLAVAFGLAALSGACGAVRTVPVAAVSGVALGALASNFVERVVTGGVVDYVAVCWPGGGGVANLPDLVMFGSFCAGVLLGLGPRRWRSPQVS